VVAVLTLMIQRHLPSRNPRDPREVTDESR
jgi:hypothetical protein